MAASGASVGPRQAAVVTGTLRHLGISLGRVAHWHDGLGEFSRQLSLALVRQATSLREHHGLCLHFHLPKQWHGEFGDQAGYLETHTTQRWLHLRRLKFSLWHNLHQHNRLQAPLGTEHQLQTVHDLNFLQTKQGQKRERYRLALARGRTADALAPARITYTVLQEYYGAAHPLAAAAAIELVDVLHASSAAAEATALLAANLPIIDGAFVETATVRLRAHALDHTLRRQVDTRKP